MAERPSEALDLDVHPLMQGIEGLRTWIIFFHAAPVNTLVRISMIIGLDPETYEENRQGLLLQLGQDDPLRAVIDLDDALAFLDEYRRSILIADRIANATLRSTQAAFKKFQHKLADAIRLGATLTISTYVCQKEPQNARDHPGIAELLESVGGIGFEDSAFRFTKESTGDVDPRKWARH